MDEIKVELDGLEIAGLEVYKALKQHKPYNGNIFIGGGVESGIQRLSGSQGNAISNPFSVQNAMNRSRDKYLKAQKWLDEKVLEDTKPFLPSVLFGFKTPCFDVDRAIFSPPATIVYWSDGTKTVVKCDPDDTYSKEAGVAFCFMKKALGNKGNYNQVLKRLVEGREAQDEGNG